MAKQTYTAGQVLTASQMSALQANDYNQTVSTKTANYVLVAADVGTRIVMNSATDATITVNTSLFAAGDTLWIHDIGAGSCTIVAGTCAVTTSSSLVVPTNGGGYLYFTSASTAIFFATGNIDTTLALSNRNVIINGAMQVAQRGTSSASITTNNYYTADRWQTAVTTLGTWTQSQEADAPTGSGFRNSLKMLCTTADASPAAADILNVQTRFEGQNIQQFLKGTASAKPFALSFWVKSNVTGTYIAELIDSNNTRQVSASYTISASATWEKKTIIFPADTTGAFTNDNALSLSLNFWLGAGSDRTSGTLNTIWASTVTANRVVGQTNLAAAISNYWQVTGVQLEAGSVATPFEFENISDTLTKCQRYYWQLTGSSSGFFGVNAGVTSRGVTANDAIIKNPVFFRDKPTSVSWGGTVSLETYYGSGAARNATAITIDSSSSVLNSCVQITTATYAASGTNQVMYLGNSTASYIGFSAEL